MNVENRSVTDKVRGKNIAAPFFLTRCIIFAIRAILLSIRRRNPSASLESNERVGTIKDFTSVAIS